LLVVVLLALVHVSQGLTIMVPANGEECFFDEVERGERVYGSYNVFSGGSLDIDIKIYGPDMRIVYEEERSTQDSFAFVAVQKGQHKLCFANSMSTLTAKMISFNLHVGNTLANHDVAKQGELF
jgi:hypothetical protein